MNKQKKDTGSFKTFLGNQKEGQGFADKRKKKAAYEYLKLLKKEKIRAEKVEGKAAPKHAHLAFLHTQQRNPKSIKKAHTYTAAEKFAKKQQEEKEKKQTESERIKKEKDAAMDSYRDRKKKQHLKLCKKTSKGQPVMRFQMEVLLEKIKKGKSEHS